MSQLMYSMYEDFLRRHELFNQKVHAYIQEHSVIINYKKIDQFSSIGCSIVLDEKGRLVEVIPSVPFLKNKKMVAINIFVYVQAMILIPNIGKVFDESSYDNVLPLVFQKLFILENSNKNLLSYEEKMIANLYRENRVQHENVVQYRDALIKSYNKDKNTLNTSARKIRRKAKDYLYRKKK